MMEADEPLDVTEANLDLAVRLLDGPGEHDGVRLGEAVFVTVEAAGGGPEHKIDWPGCQADEGMAIMRVADAGLAIEAAANGVGRASMHRLLAEKDIAEGPVRQLGERSKSS